MKYNNILFGPPYSTGKMHVGNAAALVAKDFYIRYLKLLKEKNPELVLNNFYNFFYSFDTQGLPNELKVEKQYIANNVIRKDIPTKEWLNKCIDTSNLCSQDLKNQFKTLNLLFDVDKTPVLHTNDLDLKLAQMAIFKNLFDKEVLYKATRHVEFCLSCNTSLANAEIEYCDSKPVPIYVIAATISSGVHANKKLLFCTTTPMTLDNNLLIGLANKNYYLYRDDKNIEYICGYNQAQNIFPNFKLVNTLSASELEGCKYYLLNDSESHYDHKSIIISSNVHHVADQSLPFEKQILAHIAGLHISPWDSFKDYELVLEQKPLFKEYISKNCDYALAKKKLLQLNLKEVLTQYTVLKTYLPINETAICWRCKLPTQTTLTNQWYLKISDENRALLINQVKNLNVFNPTLKKKFISWVSVENKDWCVSRSRNYGTPIPLYTCANENCSEKNVEKSISFSKTDFNNDKYLCFYPYLNELLEKKNIRCETCNSKTQIVPFSLDVWTDAACLAFYNQTNPEFDFLIEGLDQIRGFFYAIAVLGILLFKKIPYNGLVFTPWFINKKKAKLSKSEGSGNLFETSMAKMGLKNYRSFCISKCLGEDVVFNEDLVLLEKKYTNNIKNLIVFLNQPEYDYDVSNLELTPEIKIKHKLFLDKFEELKLALHDCVISGNFSKYWLLLREFLLQDYSRSLINNYKVEARTCSSTAHLIKKTGIELLKYAQPVLGDLI